MEEDAGKSLHEGFRRFRSQDLSRLQPQRRAADRDRQRARHALGGGSRGVLRDAAADPGVARRQRRQHGRGQPALRRQRVGPAARRDDARHQGGSEERQLVPLSREGDRLRDRPADRRARARRPRRAGDAAVRLRRRARPTRCAARKKRTTTATSPSRTCRRWSSTRRVATRSRARCRSCPRRAGAASSREYALPEYDAGAADAVARRSPTTSRRRRALSGNPKAASNWVMGEVLRDAEGARHRRSTQVPITPAALAGLIAHRRQGHHQQHGREGRVREDVRDRAARPTTSSRPKAWRRSPTTTRSIAIVRDVHRGAIRMPWQQFRRAGKNAVRLPGRPGDEGDEGQGRPEVVTELLKRATSSGLQLRRSHPSPRMPACGDSAVARRRCLRRCRGVAHLAARDSAHRRTSARFRAPAIRISISGFSAGVCRPGLTDPLSVLTGPRVQRQHLLSRRRHPRLLRSSSAASAGAVAGLRADPRRRRSATTCCCSLLARAERAGHARCSCASVTGSTAAAFVAGLAWACWPYRTAHLLHIQLQALYFLPLALLFLHRLVAGRRWRDASAARRDGRRCRRSRRVYYGVMTAIAIASSAASLAVDDGAVAQPGLLDAACRGRGARRRRAGGAGVACRTGARSRREGFRP